MAQTKTIQLLRSQAVSANLEAAKQVLLGVNGTGAKTAKDGEIVLVRYYANNDQTTIKSILGIYHKDQPLEDGSINGWTILEDVASSVEGLEHLQNEVNAIETSTGLKSDGTKDNFSGDDVLQVVEANDSLLSAISKIADRIGKMDKAASAVDGQVVTTVSEANGVVSETKANLTDIVMAGYAADTTKTGAIAATDTLEQAFNKVENAITNTTVKSSDKTVKITDNSGKDLSVNIDGTTLVKDATNGTISSALKVIKVIPTGTAGTDEVVDANLPTNVKEAYRLVYNGSNTAIGQQINVYKDSALANVYLGHVDDKLSGEDTTTHESASNTVVSGTGDDALCFVYQLANGNYKLTTVNVESFLQESEFKDGLSVNSSTHGVSVNIGNGLEFTGSGSNRPIAVKKDSTSENFLSVSANGVKVSGVQDAIDAVKVTTDNTGATYVNLAVDSAGRALTLTNTMQAMATADSTRQGLAEASDVKTYVDNAVAGKNVTAEGDDYVSATATNNKVTVATDVQNLTFTQGSGSTDSTLTGTAQSLADGSDIATKVSSFTNARISEEIAKLDSSVSATAEENNQYSVLTGVTEADGKLTSKTEVTLAAVAKTGAAADVSVADSDGKLTATNVEAALAEIVDKADASLNSVSSTNGVIAVAAKDANKNQALTFQVSAACAKQADGTTNMLTIENDGLKLSDTWDCGTF